MLKHCCVFGSGFIGQDATIVWNLLQIDSLSLFLVSSVIVLWLRLFYLYITCM